MGNYFATSSTASNTDTNSSAPPVGGDVAQTTPKRDVEAEMIGSERTPLPGSQRCVAWEIDVSNWTPRGRGNKTKVEGIKSSHLREKYLNNSVGGAERIESDDVKPELVKVTLPIGTHEARLPQCCEDIKEKKVLDLKRWYCMSRPQYQKSCGITSVVSCWNYLFSTLGNGRLQPITQEGALEVLGFAPPYGEIKFGPFTGNVTVMKWFRQLCAHYGVSGKAYYFYKLHGRGRTAGVKPSRALEKLKEGLRDDSIAFIYHCHNHYFCPIGYEEVAKSPHNAYCINLEPSQYDSWILIGEPNRKRTGIHWKRWHDVYTDLNCQNPEYFNIRQTEKGIQTRKTKRKGGNLHCIMAFKRLLDEETTIADKENVGTSCQESQDSYNDDTDSS